jgi:hypothetical protein
MGFHQPQDVVEHPQGAEAPRAPGRPGSAALEVWCQRLKPRRKRFKLRRKRFKLRRKRLRPRR